MFNVNFIYSRILKKIRGVATFKSEISNTSKIESGSSIISSKIDRYSFCGYDCLIVNCDIGAFCSIASRVSIGGATHPIKFVSTSPVFLSHRDSVRAKFARHDYLPEIRTNIGCDVWIGEGVYVKAGISIGHGSIVGMGSVVTKDVPPYSIIAGNPAKLIRMRFDQDIIESLLKMQWWRLPESELIRLGPLFNDPVAMLKAEGLL